MPLSPLENDHYYKEVSVMNRQFSFRYNGSHVKTSNEELMGNNRPEVCPVTKGGTGANGGRKS